MPGKSDPRRAIVAVWYREVGSNGEFLGSGAFISPRLVLTAKHLVEDKKPQEIRFDFISGQHAVPAEKIHVHEKYDIALIELIRDFDDQDFVYIDYQNSNLDAKKIDLYGVNPDTKSRDQCNGYTLGTWNSSTREYLFDHAQRKGFSGGIAVSNGYVIGVISKRHTTEQQGVMVPLHVVSDWLGRFIGLKKELFYSEISSAPIPPIAQIEFTKKIREQVRCLLDQPRAQSLYNEIVRRGDGESAVDILIPQQSDFSIEVIDLMYHATKDCLDKLVEQKLDLVDLVKEIARKVFGWLVLLAVDMDRVHYLGCGFNPWQAGTEATVPLESEAGTEVLISSLGDKYACFILKYDKKGRVRAGGRDCFAADDLEDGLLPDDRLKGILQSIWVAAKIEGEAPNHLEQLKKKLKPKLEGRERRRQGHYYITVPSKGDGFPRSDTMLLKSLLAAIPSLRVIYIGGGQDDGILLLEEDSLWESIEAFLLMLRDTPYDPPSLPHQ